MKYFKLFESYTINKDEFPFDGNYFLSKREKVILSELVGRYYFKFNIKKEDGYYYTIYNDYHNKFERFSDLKDYIQFQYSMYLNDVNGFLEFIETTNLDMSFDNNYAIKWASENGYAELVKLLLQDPRVDPSADDNYAIGLASENGHNEIVELLLKDPIVDPSADDNYAIRSASSYGHIEIVKLLLQDPRVDPSLRNNHPIKWASYYGHKEVVKILLKDPRVRSKLTHEEINKYTNEIS